MLASAFLWSVHAGAAQSPPRQCFLSVTAPPLRLFPPFAAPVAQDLLTYSLKGLACWADFARRQGEEVPQEVYSLLNAATFATLTNVNFDDERFKVGR